MNEEFFLILLASVLISVNQWFIFLFRINASRLAMNSKGSHFVSLDKVIITMMTTGQDMQTKYKETSRGGLAVNMVEC